MIEEVTKVDVEKFSRRVVKHKIARMSVSYSKHICCNTLASKRTKESFVIGLKPILAFCLGRGLSEHGQLSLVFHKVLHHRKSGEGSAEKVVVLVHLCNHSSFINELNITCLEARLKHIIANHVQFQTARLPETIHNLEKLQYQIVLL